MRIPAGHSPVAAETPPPLTLRVGVSAIAPVLLTAVAAAAALPWVSDDSAPGAAAKIIIATLAVGVLPGVLITLVWRPRQDIGLLELVAIGIAVSMVTVHLLTMAMFLLHASVSSASFVLLAAEGVAAAWLWSAHRVRGMTVRIDPDDATGLALLVLIATCLYAQGAPFGTWEDQVHVSIVRRLSALPRLALDNFYLTPGVVYTYPFPSTHAFMSLVTRLADTDALFVYHKLRFFWGPAALLMIYLGARAVFGRAALGTAAMATAGVLTLTGVFAVVDEEAYWAQLAAFSHASDVAMAVLLPALLAVTYRCIEADTPRERGMMAAAAIGLSFTLTVVHIREAIQYFAYLSCFVAVASACARFRPQARRGAVLLGVSLALAALFLVWHARSVGHISDQVASERNRLGAIAAAMSLHDLLLGSAEQSLSSFVLWFDAAFTGINQWLLLAAPLAIVAFRERALAWLIAASLLAYLLVMNIPALAIPYIYLTYHEILVTPIRNLTPFFHMLAGPVLYVLAAAAWALVRPIPLAIIALAGTGAALGGVAALSPVAANQSELRFFAPVICAWLATFLWLDRTGPRPTLGRLRVGLGIALAMIALALLWPDRDATRPPAEVNVRWAPEVTATARATIERQLSLQDGRALEEDGAGAWAYDLADTSTANVRALVKHPSIADTHHINRKTFEFEQPRGLWFRYPPLALLRATAVGLWASGFLLPLLAAPNTGPTSAATRLLTAAPFHYRAGLLALPLIPFVLMTVSPQALPVSELLKHPGGEASTPGAALRLSRCITATDVTPPLGETSRQGTVRLAEVQSCPLTPEAVSWIRAHVAVDGVFAVDRWNVFMPTMFVPQQVVTFSGTGVSLTNEAEIYPAYFERYRSSIRDRGVQPFFNVLESAEERRAFVTALGVTHVLVDPQYYADLGPVLDALPEMFTRRFADGRWAIYEVRRGA